VSPQKSFFNVHGRRLFRFGAVGLSGVVVNNVVLFLLVEKLGWSPVVASVVATEVAILNNFALNDRWTFFDSPRRHGWRTRLASYNLLTLGGLLISVAVLATLTYLGHVHYLIANLFAIGAGTGWNYLSNHGWTWSLHIRTGVPKAIDSALSGETAP